MATIAHVGRSTPTCALFALLMLAMAAPKISFAADPEVRFESGRFWVRTTGDVAARRLLEVIGERTGIEFLLDPEIAGQRLHVEIEGLDLERALPQLVKQIPGVGGYTKSYLANASGEPRLATVNVFAVGKAPAESPTGDAGGLAETVVIAAPTPSARELEAQEERLIESGVPAETARRFIDLTSEVQRLQKTPGATDALIRSERYRETMREIGEAQGKGSPPEEEP